MAGQSPNQHQERWRPDDVQELLISNLFPVTSSPSTIWSAVTSLKAQEGLCDRVPTGDGVIINGGKLYTFAQLADELCPVRALVDVRTISNTDRRDEWVADKEKGRLYTWLLNAYLRKYLEDIGLIEDEKGRFFFPPPQGKARLEVHGREVTARKPSHEYGQVFWVHLAAYIRFCRIQGRFFLRIIPCFLFTQDGKTPLDGKKMGRLCIKWGGRQRNANILRDVIFWASLLKRGGSDINIPAGTENIVVRALPATTRLNKGIRADHIHFTKLIRLARDELSQVAKDVEILQPEEDEDELSSE